MRIRNVLGQLPSNADFQAIPIDKRKEITKPDYIYGLSTKNISIDPINVTHAAMILLSELRMHTCILSEQSIIYFAKELGLFSGIDINNTPSFKECVNSLEISHGRMFRTKYVNNITCILETIFKLFSYDGVDFPKLYSQHGIVPRTIDAGTINAIDGLINLLKTSERDFSQSRIWTQIDAALIGAKLALILDVRGLYIDTPNRDKTSKYTDVDSITEFVTVNPKMVQMLQSFVEMYLLSIKNSLEGDPSRFSNHQKRLCDFITVCVGLVMTHLYLNRQSEGYSVDDVIRDFDAAVIDSELGRSLIHFTSLAPEAFIFVNDYTKPIPAFMNKESKETSYNKTVRYLAAKWMLEYSRLIFCNKSVTE